MEHISHPIKCKHELEYCENCNLVFCKKCKEEWKKETVNCPNIPYMPNGTGTLPWSNVTYC